MSQRRKSIRKAKKDAEIEKMKFGIFLECANRAVAVGSSFKKLWNVYREFMEDTPFIGAIVGGELASGEFPMNNCSVVSCLAGY